jgi:hypothetical protein
MPTYCKRCVMPDTKPELRIAELVLLDFVAYAGGGA